MPDSQQIDETNKQSRLDVYSNMRFRDLYNIVAINRESYMVIQQETKIFSESVVKLFDGLSSLLKLLNSNIVGELRQEYISKKADRYSELTVTKRVYDDQLQPNIDPHLDLGHK